MEIEVIAKNWNGTRCIIYECKMGLGIFMWKVGKSVSSGIVFRIARWEKNVQRAVGNMDLIQLGLNTDSES